jgi:hypothetical protein
MDEVAYHRTCPICGGVLLPNAGPPTVAPWRCDQDLISWWVAELTPAARQVFRVREVGWGARSSRSYKEVRRAVLLEREEAIRRGSSLRREQIGLVSPMAIKGLLRLGLPLAREHREALKGRLA